MKPLCAFLLCFMVVQTAHQAQAQTNFRPHVFKHDDYLARLDDWNRCQHATGNALFILAKPKGEKAWWDAIGFAQQRMSGISVAVSNMNRNGTIKHGITIVVVDEDESYVYPPIESPTASKSKLEARLTHGWDEFMEAMKWLDSLEYGNKLATKPTLATLIAHDDYDHVVVFSQDEFEHAKVLSKSDAPKHVFFQKNKAVAPFANVRMSAKQMGIIRQSRAESLTVFYGKRSPNRMKASSKMYWARPQRKNSSGEVVCE